ncbi:MAG: hypothetical protein LBW85_09430 [Deltaproteobacteria bacterium]|jgi:hypothetical protein|nr:hypothetical protein [Deltaproteobacteria bacterium]
MTAAGGTSGKVRRKDKLQAEGREPLVRGDWDRSRGGALDVMKEHALRLERDACGEESPLSRNERSRAAAEYANGLLEAADPAVLRAENRPMDRGDRIAGALYLAASQGIHWVSARRRGAGERADLFVAGVLGVLKNLRNYLDTGQSGGYRDLFGYLSGGAAEEARCLTAERRVIRIPKDVATALNRFRDFQEFLEAAASRPDRGESVKEALGRGAAGTARRVIAAARGGEPWLEDIVRLYNSRLSSRPGRFKETTVEGLVTAARAYAEHGGRKVSSLDDRVGPVGEGKATVLDILSEAVPDDGPMAEELVDRMRAREKGRELRAWDGLFRPGSLEARILARLPEEFPDYMSYVYMLADMDSRVLELLSEGGRLEGMADLEEMKDILNDRKEFLLTSRKEDRREAAGSLFYRMAVHVKARAGMNEPAAWGLSAAGKAALEIWDRRPGGRPVSRGISDSPEAVAADSQRGSQPHGETAAPMRTPDKAPGITFIYPTAVQGYQYIPVTERELTEDYLRNGLQDLSLDGYAEPQTGPLGAGKAGKRAVTGRDGGLKRSSVVEGLEALLAKAEREGLLPRGTGGAPAGLEC